MAGLFDMIDALGNISPGVRRRRQAREDYNRLVQGTEANPKDVRSYPLGESHPNAAGLMPPQPPPITEQSVAGAGLLTGMDPMEFHARASMLPGRLGTESRNALLNMQMQEQRGDQAMTRQKQQQEWATNNLTLAEKLDLDIKERQLAANMSGAAAERAIALEEDRNDLIGLMRDDARQYGVNAKIDVLQLHNSLRDQIEKDGGKITPPVESMLVKGLNKAVLNNEAVMSDDLQMIFGGYGGAEGLSTLFSQWVDPSTGQLREGSEQDVIEFYDTLAENVERNLERQMVVYDRQLNRFRGGAIPRGDVFREYDAFEPISDTADEWRDL